MAANIARAIMRTVDRTESAAREGTNATDRLAIGEPPMQLGGLPGSKPRFLHCAKGPTRNARILALLFTRATR